VAPAAKNQRENASPASLRDAGNDVLQLVIAYVKQETIGPLRAVGRFLIFGIAGSVALAVGAVLGLVAVLRLLQEETGAFHGNLSWIPYLIVSVLGAGIIALAAWRVTRGPGARRARATDEGGN
jgi:hypothetical protein